MGLAFPWALAALLSVPILVWLHKRRDRPVPVDLPSLLFLEGEDVPAAAPRLVRVDRELILALLAALCLSLAAAGPSVRIGGAGKVVRVATIPGPRAADAVAAIRAAAGASDRVDVVEVRRDDRALLAAVRTGDADLRVIVTDRFLVPEPRDVRVVAVGDPKATNVGIVAADLISAEAGLTVFLNLWNDSPEASTVTVAFSEVPYAIPGALVRSLHLGEKRVNLPSFSARSVTFAAGKGLSNLSCAIVEKRLEGWVNSVQEDDDVFFDAAWVSVGFAAGQNPVPEAHRKAVLDGLHAVLGDALVADDEKPDLWIGTSANAPTTAKKVLVLHPLPPNGRGVRVPAGATVDPGPWPYSRHLDATGCDLVYSPDVKVGAPYPLVRARGNVVEFLPDPLAGNPAPVDHPIWPIFLENLVSEAFGRPGPAGYRISGVLDLEQTRMGRDVRPFDAAWLADVKPARPAPERSLVLPLIAGGVAAMALLWLFSRSPRAVEARAG